MCYAYGAVKTAVSVCPMCKVFPHARCPHQREICRNRSLHPRMDVIYLKNAEVDLFNGCGYCKWARTNPPAPLSGVNNPGWPGCCRAPAQSEIRQIQAYEWKAVSIVHQVLIPSEVKSTVDTLSPNRSKSLSTAGKQSSPPVDRRNSSSPGRSNGISKKNDSSVALPIKGRSGGSSNGSGSSGSPSSSPRVAPAFEVHGLREALSDDRKSPLSDKKDAPQSPPARKSGETDQHRTPRKQTSTRHIASVASSTPSRGPANDPKSSNNVSSPSAVRATPNSVSNNHTPTKNSSAAQSSAQVTASKSAKPPQSPDSESGKSRGSSSGTGSDSTITSDGGFTDYLSDESEAELQRQAEAKAALMAQSQAEEMEFKAARQRLVGVDLKPPNSWSGTNITNTRSAPATASPVAKSKA